MRYVVERAADVPIQIAKSRARCSPSLSLSLSLCRKVAGGVALFFPSSGLASGFRSRETFFGAFNLEPGKFSRGGGYRLSTRRLKLSGRFLGGQPVPESHNSRRREKCLRAREILYELSGSYLSVSLPGQCDMAMTHAARASRPRRAFSALGGCHRAPSLIDYTHTLSLSLPLSLSLSLSL